MRSLLGILAIAAAFSTAFDDAEAEPPRGAVYTNLDRNCQIYSEEVIINGRPTIIYGHACLQPDGSYRIMHDAIAPPQATPRSDGIAGAACRENIGSCDRSCDDHGILGARHVHADCSRTCDLICGNREGYAPWGD
jgi:hypothetical protein